MDPTTTRLPQPDSRSCGAAVLVMARMLDDPGYAARVGSLAGWRAEVLAMHRRATSSADVRGRLQMPWPRALGTPPWAIARQLSGSSGVAGTTYRPRPVLPHRREAALARIRAAARAGHVVPLYVGNRWLPRHVVLVLDETLTTYEPASGRRLRIDPDLFVAADLGLAGWSHPWFSVLPE